MDQLDLQSLHRVRERWVMRRTAVINQVRGLLLERGITLRKGRAMSMRRCRDTGRRRRQAIGCIARAVGSTEAGTGSSGNAHRPSRCGDQEDGGLPM
jgi:hypothetical protein